MAQAWRASLSFAAALAGAGVGCLGGWLAWTLVTYSISQARGVALNSPGLVVFAAWTLLWGASSAALALAALGQALAPGALGALAGGLAGLALSVLLGAPVELVQVTGSAGGASPDLVAQGRAVLLVGALAAVGGATLAQLWPRLN